MICFRRELIKRYFVDKCIKKRIQRGKILDLSTLPPWVPDVLKRTIRKATHINPEKRFASASAFHTHLNNIKNNIPDWSVIEGRPVLITPTISFRILEKDNHLYVQKSKNGGVWRRDNLIIGTSLSDIVCELEGKI
ncbi:hypothetical protein [Pseudomonas petroselini]|uniref:hypothetical protein n=1 Tax=Pseudomonas petroselini TaxID=2899822 RepID=UPI001E5C488F|nr:hypothetical protein [Pseudomonas petroselini]MCD7043667.1 hypothetical protein [Pseudomonas petroselini]